MQYFTQRINQDELEVMVQSPRTKKWNAKVLPINASQWEAFMSPNRPLIQNIFPHLSNDEREFIKTGYTQEDWDAIFPKED